MRHFQQLLFKYIFVYEESFDLFSDRGSPSRGSQWNLNMKHESIHEFTSKIAVNVADTLL